MFTKKEAVIIAQEVYWKDYSNKLKHLSIQRNLVDVFINANALDSLGGSYVLGKGLYIECKEQG